jgi:hypothetical protein
MRRQSAGTDDSVYPSDEYMRILRGRVRHGSAEAGVENPCLCGEVKDCVRNGGGGGGGVEVG